jgi:hypothetical protein
MRQVFLTLVTVMLLMVPATVQAIRVCHDYTFYRVFRTDPDPPGGVMSKKSAYLSADSLRRVLKKNGYNSFSVINSYQLPNFPKILKQGYVVIIEDAHSGFINEKGNVDHFLQPSKSIGTYFTVKDLEEKYLAPLKENEEGGLFLNDTWKTFVERRFSPNPIGKIEIWRK